MDALVIYETLHGPKDGYFGTLLYNDDFKKDFNGRLQLVYDTRFREFPVWQLAEFEGYSGTATKMTELRRDEIYGYLKARFPDKNWRDFIKAKVKEITMKLFE